MSILFTVAGTVMATAPTLVLQASPEEDGRREESRRMNVEFVHQ
jgi:hypothetical protein